MFDYVLYLACLVFVVELAYLEFRFHLLRTHWDHYLLLSAALYFALAYRFDNRLVLSLALATLAGWFGVRLSHLALFVGDQRACALAYGALVALGGVGVHRAGDQEALLDTYLHIATNVLLMTLVSGVAACDPALVWAWLPGLLGAGGVAIVEGVQTPTFHIRGLWHGLRLCRPQCPPPRRRPELHVGAGLRRNLRHDGHPLAGRALAAFRARRMRRYSRLDEERMRVQAHVRQWTRAGLLDASQGARLEAELRPGVRRTNDALRAALALFTCLIVGASVLWVGEVFNLKSDGAMAVAAGLASVACIAFAELLVGALRFYRHGVEEALAVSAALLLSVSASKIAPAFHNSQIIAALAAGAGGLFYLYRRFGFVYAAVGAMASAVAIVFQFDVSWSVQRALAAAALASVFAVARAKRLGDDEDVRGDEYGTLQAAAWGGVYLTLNLHAWDVLGVPPIARAGAGSWFYWGDVRGDVARAGRGAAPRHSREGSWPDRRQPCDGVRDRGDEQALPRLAASGVGSDRARPPLHDGGDRPAPVAVARAGQRARRLYARADSRLEPPGGRDHEHRVGRISIAGAVARFSAVDAGRQRRPLGRVVAAAPASDRGRETADAAPG